MKVNVSLAAKQGLLIRIARIAWAMYASFLAKFTVFNVKYTTTYGDDALKEVDATAALPSEAKVSAALTALLNIAKAAALVCTDYWQNLSAYIADTFDPADWEAARKEAGSALYTKATEGNWANLLKLLEQMTLFIKDNLATLTKDGKGMPVAFPELVGAAKTACEQALQNYSVGYENAKLQTAARQMAYKNVQTKLKAMLNDAKQVFKRDQATLQTFTFAAIKRSLSPEKTGLCLTIKDGDKMPVTTTHLSIQPARLPAGENADPKGIISIKILPGSYTCTLTTPGYETKILTNVKIISGATKRIKVTLKKEAASSSHEAS